MLRSWIEHAKRSALFATQGITDSHIFDAFGMTVSRTGTTPTPFGFVGKAQYQTDNDSGLQLLGHRYYDAIIRRFISSDPAKSGDNRYDYCANNPVIHIDPSGYDLLDEILTLGGGATAGIGVGVELTGEAAVASTGPVGWGTGLAIAGVVITLRPIYHAAVRVIDAYSNWAKDYTRRHPNPIGPKYPPGSHYHSGFSQHEIVGPDGTILGSD